MEDALGGAVWVSLFFSQTWDEARIDIFPHGSERGTFSNGVQSQNVNISQPLTPDSYSFTIHSRGTVFNQRRWAPWSPRAGHLHVGSDRFDTLAET